MISYIVPSRDRPEDLARTLGRIGSLPEHAQGGAEAAEVIVVDNASRHVPVLDRTLRNGMAVRHILLDENKGAAARTIGARHAHRASRWLVMLDDDSHPVDGRFVDVLQDVPEDVGALMADIRLPMQGRREDGGLPEVFVGCGVALRRELFDRLGGYDETFGYYAEEYDLAARIIAAGFRIAFEPRFRVDHFKAPGGRDMNTIVARLVRNGSWVMQRYAPESDRRAQLRETRRRCRLIAELEGAVSGYIQGLREARQTLRAQERRPLNRMQFDRFTGLWHARQALRRAHAHERFDRATIVARGKNAWVVARVLAELGVEVVPDAEVLVIGTMSPGPMLDARAKFQGSGRVLTPWAAAERVVRG